MALPLREKKKGDRQTSISVIWNAFKRCVNFLYVLVAMAPFAYKVKKKCEKYQSSQLVEKKIANLSWRPFDKREPSFLRILKKPLWSFLGFVLTTFKLAYRGSGFSILSVLALLLTCATSSEYNGGSGWTESAVTPFSIDWSATMPNWMTPAKVELINIITKTGILVLRKKWKFLADVKGYWPPQKIL